ncbi:MAG: thioredoxin family protein [Thermoplasmata archaeon]|nr:MAG: thioredoxin family protein [Thermoplasmata archaeon]
MGVKEHINDFLSAHPKFRANVGTYDPNKDILKKIGDKIKGTKIKVFSANWCQDCRIQIPRLFSVIIALDHGAFELEIIEVDRSKMDENKMAEAMNVLAIPTFIFFRNGEELGRIIEGPKGRLEEDILEIIG